MYDFYKDVEVYDFPEEKFNEMEIGGVIEENMMSYSAYVVLYRSIPDWKDGLKPVQRRILETMRMMKANNFLKSVKIVGRVSDIHPHGDTYLASCNLSQKDRYHIPYIVGSGKLGSFTSSMPASASRYTDMKLSDYTKEHFMDIDKDIIPHIKNYAGDIDMPEFFPTKFPNILITQQKGVAVGMSTNYFSYNMKEVSDVIKEYYRNGVKNVIAPDFATGGYIKNDFESFEKMMNTSSGQITVRGKVEVDNKKITLRELPYGVTREAYISNLLKLMKETNKFDDIAKVNDSSDLKNKSVVVRVKNGKDVQQVVNKLYKFTKLETKLSINRIVLDDYSPKEMSFWDIVEKWVEWRKDIVVKILNKKTNSIKKEIDYINILKKLSSDRKLLDSVIDISISSDKVVEDISETLLCSIDVAESISNIRLSKLNKKYLQSKIKDVTLLENELKECEKHLNDPLEYIFKEFDELVTKYGYDRKTEIVEFEKVVIKKDKKEIEQEQYNCKVVVTKNNFFYKFKDFDTEPELNFKDEIKSVFYIKNSSNIMMFMKDNNTYLISVNDIPLNKPKDIGTFIENVCDLKNDYVNDNLLAITHQPSNNEYIVFAYKNGRVAKINGLSYETKTRRKKLSNSLPTKHTDDLLCIKVFDAKNIVIESNLRKHKDIINIQNNRNSSGRQLLLKKDEYLVDVL